jgi:hypothetical protein
MQKCGLTALKQVTRANTPNEGLLILSFAVSANIYMFENNVYEEKW